MNLGSVIGFKHPALVSEQDCVIHFARFLNHAHWRHAAEVLTEPWRERGRRRKLLRAGIVVALSFDTWRMLTREQ